MRIVKPVRVATFCKFSKEWVLAGLAGTTAVRIARPIIIVLPALMDTMNQTQAACLAMQLFHYVWSVRTGHFVRFAEMAIFRTVSAIVLLRNM